MNSVLKYPGSKWNIADWIIGQMPAHHSYVEPYCGSCAVFLRKQSSSIETLNDLDSEVVNLFQCIRENPDRLAAMVAATPYSRSEYSAALTNDGSDNYERARQFLVRCWQGYGYRTNEHKVGWKSDVQGREAAYAMRNWYRLPVWIMNIVDRLREAQLECRPAVEVIKRFNYANVLIYADPPYLLSTRTAQQKQYAHEMSDADHEELLMTLLQHKGTVLLSGYDSDLYNDLLKGWHKAQISTTAEQGLPRTETLWMNFSSQLSLFDSAS